MSLKKTLPVVFVLMAVVLVFSSSACSKLNINKLQANHHFQNANTSFKDQRYRDAIEEYEKALELNPELTQAYLYLGEAYKQLYKPMEDNERNVERAEKALEALKKAYAAHPEDSQVIHSLADMYDKMQNFEEAEKLFLEILEQDPTNMGNYYVVAEFYKRYAGQDGDEEEGAEGTEGAEGEERAEGEEGAEEVETAEGKTPHEKAEEMYLRRIETDPLSPQGYAYVAEFYQNLTPTPAFDKAYFYHMKRTDLEPDNPEAWLAVGVNRWAKSYRLQSQLTREQRLAAAKESEEALLKANELDPSYPEPYSWLSVLYQSVLINIDPDRAPRYKEDAERYLEQFKEARQREADREKLEKDLKEIK
ncbi:MAG: tetratricopeptide repeat protein [Candidatus Aminicenantaceae bacterium]